MRNWRRKFFLLGVVIVIFAVAVVLNLFSGPFAIAHGEEAKQETAQEEKVIGEYGLETMTVTAQKKGRRRSGRADQHGCFFRYSA